MRRTTWGRPAPPVGYGVVTVLTAVAGLGMVLVALATRVLLLEDDSGGGSTGGWGLDLSEAVLALTWWVLGAGAVVAPLAVAAWRGHDAARLATAVVAGLIACGTASLAVVVLPLVVAVVWWVVVVVVLLRSSSRSYCRAVREERAERRVARPVVRVRG